MVTLAVGRASSTIANVSWPPLSLVRRGAIPADVLPGAPGLASHPCPACGLQPPPPPPPLPGPLPPSSLPSPPPPSPAAAGGLEVGSSSSPHAIAPIQETANNATTSGRR